MIRVARVAASSPSSKRIKTSAALSHSNRSSAQHQAALLATSASTLAPQSTFPISAHTPQPLQPANPRKRRSPPSTTSVPSMPGHLSGVMAPVMSQAADTIETTPKKKGRTNTPWTAEEEQRLKAMRDTGKSWSEIAKTFPARTEGSVKKHWYKDMHYAEFGEDESIALRDAIKEYEANKWKACEQYAKEHFKAI
ncbi:hypothetical protein UA08_08357 [Talaromyces atroroseus]|uniref:Uncharacterized protein n=1 Tax=Talaromyces atroroseus TaxID=1441469 RepID=A0A225AM44_TALAT|nr:hypothetical protein UA08_08357 [Talaromyces atroroseus]OKL56639.1 hypothetical protein UA08_08357 [Talaromyces atroroseus]